jgi:hypothetical protein
VHQAANHFGPEFLAVVLAVTAYVAAYFDRRFFGIVQIYHSRFANLKDAESVYFVFCRKRRRLKEGWQGHSCAPLSKLHENNITRKQQVQRKK